MNTPSSSLFEAQGNAPATMTAPRPMRWCVQRELWENRFLFIAPLFVASVVLFASLMNIAIGLPKKMRTLETVDAAMRHALVVTPFSMAPAPIMLATFIVGLFYSLDALYGERRDRSILFWKSLPVSDRTTVLSKATIPVLVLPLIALALSVATVAIMLLASTVILLANGISPAPVWIEFRFFQEPLIMIYGLTVHAMWFAPIYCWLLMVSVGARRAPFLWAVLPLLAVSAVERIAFNTSHFMHMLQYRVMGAMGEAFAFQPKHGSSEIMDQVTQLAPARFLTRPGLWAGLVFAAVFLAVAVRLRRNREPI